jgi:hypothetical protein
MIVSPCVLQPSGKCYWATMHNWQSNKIRYVPWVDFQAPMFKRKFIEKVQQYDNDLIYGWGNDVYSGMVCEDNDWNIAVIDWVSIIHWDGGTINKEKKLKNYNNKANQGMFNYFKKINQYKILLDYRNKAKDYQYDL